MITVSYMTKIILQSTHECKTKMYHDDSFLISRANEQSLRLSKTCLKYTPDTCPSGRGNALESSDSWKTALQFQIQTVKCLWHCIEIRIR